MKYFVFIMLGSLLLVSIAKADKVQVVSFSFDEVEARMSGEYDYVETTSIGTLPIDVLEEDARGWVRLATDYSTDFWVSKSAIKLNTHKPVVDCKSMALAKNQHKQQHGTRGAGEGCQ